MGKNNKPLGGQNTQKILRFLASRKLSGLRLIKKNNEK